MGMFDIQGVEYDLFISYAGADNKLYPQYIEHFRDDLADKLSSHPDLKDLRERKPNIFFDTRSLKITGDIEQNLQKAITTSMFLVLMVTRNYLDSDWCFKELDYFRARFNYKREEAFERTFILVLEQQALPDVTPWPEEQFGQEKPKFIHFYNDAGRGTGPCPRQIEGGVNINYQDELSRMVERMDELYRMTIPRPAMPPPKEHRQEQPSERNRVLLGVVSQDLMTARKKLKTMLEEREINAIEIEEKDLSYSSRQDLEARVDPSMTFIQLISYANPVLDFQDHLGHLVLQTAILKSLGDRAPQEMIWCHPASEPGVVTAEAIQAASPVVVDYVNSVLKEAPSCTTLEEVVECMTDGGEFSELNKVYVESTQVDTHAGRQLRRKLEEIWTQRYGRKNIPKFYAMRWGKRFCDKLAECQGVILLYGNKDEDSLEAQVDVIDRAVMLLDNPPRQWVAVAPPHEKNEGDLFWDTFSSMDDEEIKDVVDDIYQAIV